MKTIAIFLLFLPFLTYSQKIKEDKIYVIGSFTIVDEKPKFTTYSFQISNSSNSLFKYTGSKVHVSGIMHMTSIKFNTADFNTGNQFVHFFIEELNIEKHSIKNFENCITTVETTCFDFAEEVEIPLKLENSKIFYIGDITFWSQGLDNGEHYEWNDHFERDKEKLFEKYPRISNYSIKNITPKEGINTKGKILFNNGLIDSGW